MTNMHLLYYKIGIFHSIAVYDVKENVALRNLMKRLNSCVLLLICAFLLVSCSAARTDKDKLRDIDYTVTNPEDIPEELASQIEEAKAEPFKLTYGDNGYLYIARGYGTKDTSGYSVEVPECFETSNAVCIKSSLLGPKKDEEVLKKHTYPYVVVKIEYNDKNVVFE